MKDWNSGSDLQIQGELATMSYDCACGVRHYYKVETHKKRKAFELFRDFILTGIKLWLQRNYYDVTIINNLTVHNIFQAENNVNIIMSLIQFTTAPHLSANECETSDSKSLGITCRMDKADFTCFWFCFQAVSGSQISYLEVVT